MPINQIAAVDFSTLKIASNPPTETISLTDDGFSAYLAQILDAQDQRAFGDQREGGFAISEDPSPYGNDPGSTVPVESEHDRHGADGSSRVTDSPKEQKPVADGPRDRQKDSKPAEPTTGNQPDGVEKVPAPGSTVRVKESDAAPQSGARSTAITDQKARTEPFSVDQVSREDSENPEADQAVSIESTLQAAVGPDQSLAVGEKIGKDRIADIDVVLDSSSRSVRDDLKEAAVSVQQRPAEKNRRGLRPASISEAGNREIADAASEERSQAGRKTRISVRDLREAGAREGDAGRSASQIVRGVGGSAADPTTGGNESQNGGDQSFATLFGAKSDGLEFSSPRLAGAATHPRTSSGVFQSLRQTLSDQVNGEIVRAAQLVVRGNDSGEIRLHLKPETLGNVRIILQMQEGHIAGRIIVENANVREVFEQNLSGLIEAFNESGLETGTLEVTLANSGKGSQGKSDGGDTRSAIRELDRAVPLVQMLDDDHNLVDLVV